MPLGPLLQAKVRHIAPRLSEKISYSRVTMDNHTGKLLSNDMLWGSKLLNCLKPAWTFSITHGSDAPVIGIYRCWTLTDLSVHNEQERYMNPSYLRNYHHELNYTQQPQLTSRLSQLRHLECVAVQRAFTGPMKCRKWWWQSSESECNTSDEILTRVTINSEASSSFQALDQLRQL